MTKQSKNRKKITKNLTAAVYDRWLFTLGGGEQVAFAYAEALRDLGYTTELLTHRAVDLTKAKVKMNVNLNGIEMRYLPEMATQAVSQFTEEYDVFVNTSYLDYFPNRSPHGILSVFFPDQIFLTPFDFAKRSFVIPFLKKAFLYPTAFEGFSYDEFSNRKLKRWLGRSSQIYFSEKIYKLQLILEIDTVNFSLLDQLKFKSGDHPIQPTSRILNHRHNRVSYELVFPTGCNTLKIILPDNEYAEKVALTKLTIRHWRFTVYNLFKNKFPRWEMRLHGGPGVTRRADLQSYQQIITISEFCKKWIWKYWRLPSDILYPPVNTQQFSPASVKKNWIVHVGRFFVTGHSKKQLDLIKAFKKLTQQKSAIGWELHFVGSIQPGKAHQFYFEQCQAEAEGYPIYFHIDIPFSQLQALLAKSKIYWHATGLDEDVEKHPILFEHFGITTVEAMASGCVPVVINAGGQPEIVEHGVSGLCWNNRDELQTHTLKLIAHPEDLSAMSKKAIARSELFDRRKFVERFQQLLKHPAT